MSALTRYTQPIDGTIPVAALLYDDERLLASQDGVGLYDGPNKSAAHQSGTIHISSHRLFFIAGAASSSPLRAPLAEDERGASLLLPLETITHTESYVGFFKSSPKVTLHLRQSNSGGETTMTSEPSVIAPTPLIASSLAHGKPVTSDSSTNGRLSPIFGATSSSESSFESWECEICGYRNPPGLSPAARSMCGLCGMPRNVSCSATPFSNTPRPSSSAAAPSKASSSSPLPVPTLSRNATASANVGSSHLFSKSLPSSSANTPPPISTMTTGEAREGERRRRKRRPSAVACSLCTFLNHPYLRECEMCGTPLPPLPSAEGSARSISDTLSSTNGAESLHATSKSAPASRPDSPALSDVHTLAEVNEKERYIRLSFRKGGDKASYAALKTALQQKEWESRDVTWKANSKASQASSGLSGINAILQNIDTTALHTERGMSDAFADLEALMSKAQDMVRLAKGLNEQLTAASRSADEPLEPEEATFVRSSLGQLGLSMKNTAVTADMSNDERKYLEQLAIELAGVLEGGSDDDLRPRAENERQQVGIMRQRGIVGLDEVWGGWNRARGVTLISPEVTLKTLPFLPQYTTPPISTRVLSSGLRVLHIPSHSTSSFSKRLLAQLTSTTPCSTTTTTQIASTESLSVGLAEELVNEVEETGMICRDDPSTAINLGAGMAIEVRWWPNLFEECTWDGQDD
ncbi:VPS36 [Sanghuangporus weigelae]